MRIETLMKSPVIFDGRNLYDPPKMRRLGFEYHRIARTTAALK
jgi:UDPglucose 6-dehydrogenase